MKVLVVGAGIFGCSISDFLSKNDIDVTLIEEKSDIMQMASKCNHNRLHLGFHYPRSKETARQSVNGLLSFVMKYKKAIIDDFENYYMISNKDSLTSTSEFEEFCDDIGLFYKKEFPKDGDVNMDMIESSFKVNEPIFDFKTLKNIVKNNLLQTDVNLKLNTEFDYQMKDNYDYIINASYYNLNKISSSFGVDRLNIKLQDVLIPIIKTKHDKIGLTIMDGPFCSIMPNGKKDNEFLVYNVVESVLAEYMELPDNCVEPDINKIMEDSKRYYPFLKDAELIDTYRTIRAIPINDNDSRLSEIITYDYVNNFISILSGKISTSEKVAMEIYDIIQNKKKRNIIL